MPESAREKTDDNALSGAESRCASLAKNARQGNRTAFHELVHLYQGAVFRMVYYRIRSQMDAEDLTQDIFLQVFKNLHRLKEAERFRSWLFSIALNRIRDFHRKKLFRAMFKASSDNDDVMEYERVSDDASETLEQLAKKDFWNRIREMLDQLSRMEQEVFLLRFFDNLSITEITRVVGKTESTVKTHLYRALNKFRNDASIQALLDYKLQ
jgi:RNA polymerase sigma-70 factor (ECF subfamily)